MKKVDWKLFTNKLWKDGLKSALAYAASCTDNGLDDVGVQLVDGLVDHLTKSEASPGASTPNA